MFESLELPFDAEDCRPEDLRGWPDPDESDEFEGDGVLPDPVLELVAARALEEFEEACEEVRRDELDADGTLAEAAGTRVKVNLVLVEQLVLAAHWADLHGVLSGTRTLPGGERLVPVGGDGTPQIAEFAPAELGAVLAMGDNAAARLIADALDLRHRFPLLWRRVQTGMVDVWLARKTVQQARGLSQAAAGRVDARIVHVAGALTWGRLRKIVDTAILQADPAKALSDSGQAAADAGARVVDEVDHGYQTMIIKAAAGDIHALDDALDVISRALKILGDTRTPDQRRAAAVGIIATPQTAQDLIAKAEQVRRLQIEAAAARRAGDVELAERIERSITDLTGDPTSTDAGQRCDRRPLAFGTTVLYYHLSKEALEALLKGEPFAGAGVMRMEDIGPVILEQVRRWLQHSNVILKPVIDLEGFPPVDRYEVPDRISEAIGLRNPADSWPYSSSTSRHQENDHTQSYVPMDRGGPAGQTDPPRWPSSPNDTTGSKPSAAGPSPTPDPAPGSTVHPTATTSSSTNTAPPHSASSEH